MIIVISFVTVVNVFFLSLENDVYVDVAKAYARLRHQWSTDRVKNQPEFAPSSKASRI